MLLHERLSMKKILCILLVLFFLPLCPGMAAEKTIVASFYPVYILAANVLDGVEGVKLSSMTAPATGCLHDYQLLTSDMRALSKAEALLINGAGMENFLPDLQKQMPGLAIVDCSQGIELICTEDHAHQDAHHDHEHGEFNAHIWLDPENAVMMVENLVSALSDILPGQAEKIQQNGAAYIARLKTLDEELAAAIAALPRKTIVTFHEAFPYFARAYGLEVAAVVALEPDEPISPRMLSQVVEAVKNAGNPPLFTEPQYDSAALTAIQQETGAAVFELDPMVTGDGALTAYEDTMRKNLSVLQAALGDE
ncbi:MAG: zinc ABC transporter substrate-binding protein [Clostridiales bacterium]|nr:zinc ABC transporter substrate-binding protein [Clostridiales bacterium]